MSKFFPPVDYADVNGFLAIGGSYEPSWLLDAYSNGIFPWPIMPDAPVCWFAPDPRAIIDFDNLHVSKRLERTIRARRFKITSDVDFGGVIQGCAAAPNRRGEVWITPQIIKAYSHLHNLGIAHSVEAWHGGNLAGGVYGIALNGLFAAESMFYYESNASKVALVELIRHIERQGFSLFDVQVINDNTARFGAVEIIRNEYMIRLRKAMRQSPSFGSLSAE